MKDEIIKIIDEIHPNLEKMMSPFMGGGCIELALAARGVKVQAYDLFRPLADFWEILTTEGGKAIAEEAAKHYPVKDREHYKSFLPLLGLFIFLSNVHLVVILVTHLNHQERIFVQQV